MKRVRDQLDTITSKIEKLQRIGSKDEICKACKEECTKWMNVACSFNGQVVPVPKDCAEKLETHLASGEKKDE